MKIDIEYENFLSGAVANNHGKDEVLWPFWPVSASVRPVMDGSVPLPKLLAAHSSSL